MLTTNCIHPEILEVLSLCGHGSKVLIADGNYPVKEKTGNARKVYLGLRPGIPTVTEVLKVLHTAVNIEKAEIMLPEDGTKPEIMEEFRKELGGMEPSGLGRYEFYDACMKSEAVALAISTGERRAYANILITIGCA